MKRHGVKADTQALRLSLPKLTIEPVYGPRFVRADQVLELVNLYHLARTALSGTSPTSYDRMLWASNQFHKANPEVSATAAYKDLCGQLGR